MAKLGWRVRSLAWVLAHAPGGSAASACRPDQMLKAQERLAGHGKLTVGVTGGLAKGVQTENRVIAQDGQEVPIRIYRADDQADGGPVIMHFHGGGWTWARWTSPTGCAARCASGSAPSWSPWTTGWPPPTDSRLRSGQLRGGELGRRQRRRVGRRRRPNRRDGRQRRRQSGHRRHPDHAGPGRPEDLPPGTDVPGHRSADAGGVRSRQHPRAPTGRSCPRPAWSPSATTTSGPDGDATDPMASPILADDLSGLPPALIQVAEYDPLRDDGIRYARALQAAGTPARLTEYVGMPHGYFSFPKVIRGSIVQALAELCAEQRYALHGVPPLDRTVPQPPARRGEPSDRHSRPGGGPPGAGPRGRPEPGSAAPRHRRPAAGQARTRRVAHRAECAGTVLPATAGTSRPSPRCAPTRRRRSGRTPALPAAAAADPSTGPGHPRAAASRACSSCGGQRTVLHLGAELVFLVDQRGDLGQDLMFVHRSAPALLRWV